MAAALCAPGPSVTAEAPDVDDWVRLDVEFSDNPQAVGVIWSLGPDGPGGARGGHGGRYAR